MWIFWCHPTLCDIKEDTVSLLLLQLPLSCLLELLLKHGIFNSLWQTDFDSAAHKNTGMGDTECHNLVSRKDLNQTEIQYRPAEFNKVPANYTHYFSHKKNVQNKTL